MTAPVYKAGEANAAAGSATLNVPVTTGSSYGDTLITVAQCGSSAITGVTDSTAGNQWTQQQLDSVEGFRLTAWTAQGVGRVGASVWPSTYADATTQAGAIAEFDSYLGGSQIGGYSGGLPMALQCMVRYYTTEGGGWPSNASNDSQGLAGLLANGVEKVVISIEPLRDATNNYTGSTYTTQKTNLSAALTYIKSVYPNVEVCLWNEPNASGNHGSFGDGSKTKNDNPSPYVATEGSSISDLQAAANYGAYYNYYAPTVRALGIPCCVKPTLSAANYAKGANNSAAEFLAACNPALIDVVSCDYYFTDSVQYRSLSGDNTGANIAQFDTLCRANGWKLGMWEWGMSDGPGRPPGSGFTTWVNTEILPIFTARLTQGIPNGDICWYVLRDTGGNNVNAGTDPGEIASIQNVFNTLNQTTCALQSGGSVTVSYGGTGGVKQGAVLGITSPPPANWVTSVEPGTPDQNVTKNNASSTNPNATSGTLAQSSEIAIAICASTGTSGALTWAGGWTSLVSDFLSPSPYVSVAYQSVTGTSAVTASATVSPAAAWEMILLTFPGPPRATGSVASPKPSLAGTGSLVTSINASGGVKLPKPLLTSGGIGNPGTPYLVGSASATAASLTITASVNVISGDSIQVGITGGTAPYTVADTAGNTYTAVITEAAAGNLYVFESDGSNALIQGVSQIFVTQSAATAFAAIAVGDNGVTGFDKDVAATGTSTSPASPSTGVLVQPEEHAIAWMIAPTAVTWGAPWASNVLSSLATNNLTVAYQRVTTTAALTATGTISPSATWAAACTTLTVTLNQVALTPSNGMQNIFYSQTLEDSGGNPPATWSISAGTLPHGLSLTGAVISGTPTTPGVYPFTITATDALSQSASLPVSITILGNTTGNNLAMATTNNLLSAADADFEVAGFSWAAVNNASAPRRRKATQLTGINSLSWASLADGPTSIVANPVNVTGNAPCVFSGALMALAARVCNLAVTWFDINGLTIKTDLGPNISATSTIWGPLWGSFTAPPNAVQAQPMVTVQASNAGDQQFIDSMYFAVSGAQVLVDWTNGPYQSGGNAGGAFMDVTPWVRLDGNGITYTRGRQDAISEIQPSSGALTLQNDAGQFAENNTVSLPVLLGGAVTLQCRTALNLADQNGNWHRRFDGVIAEINYDFDNTGNTSIANVTLTDVLSFLNRQDALFCWTRNQVLADDPLYLWALDDSGTLGGSGVAAETSGNNGPPMRVTCSDPAKPTVATIAWQDTSAGVETLADAASAVGADGSTFWGPGSNQPNSPLRGLISGTVGPFTTPQESVRFTPAAMINTTWTASTQTAQNTFLGNQGFLLSTELAAPLAPTATGSDYSIEIWMMPDVTIANNLSYNGGPFIALGLGSSSTKTNLLAGIFLNAGAAKFECATYNQPPSFLGLNWPAQPPPAAIASTSAAFVPDTTKRPHHVVITISGDPAAASVTLWLDGVQVGSGFTLPAGQTYDTICIGGAYGGCGAFFGNLSLASIYPYVLSPQQITQHCQLGQYGMWECTTDDCIAQIASYASIPSFWSNLGARHNGLSLTDYLDLTNSNAISNMQQYETAERGLLYVNNLGALTFHTRAWRMGYDIPDLLLPPNVFDAALQYEVIDQFMCNEQAISGPNTLGAAATTLLLNPATGQTQTQTTTNTVIQAAYINAASQARYGVYATSPVSSPMALPLITWSRGYAALGLPAYSYWQDPSLIDRAAWDANAPSQPWVLPATLIIDLLSLDPLTGLGISNFYTLDIDNMIAPTPGSLPPSFPNSQTSLEWFIEGVTETYSLQARTIQFFTSPAEWQRAWIPGDPAYGILGSTTRLGISGTDLSTVQAYGKDAAHDGGPPYWPPQFNNSMNAPPVVTGGDAPTMGSAGGFIGAADMRGIAGNLQSLLKPPICVVTATSQTQSFTNGALTGTSPPNVATLYWDVLHVDSAGGMGAVPGWPNWYLVTVPGYYDIDAYVSWSLTSAQSGYTGQGWIIVGQASAQALAAGTGNPLTVDQYVCPVGEAVRFNSNTMTPICAPTTRMYLGLGDMVAIGAEQNFTGARGTTTAGAGSGMSLRFVGLGKVDDRTLINSSIGTGGTVSLVSHGALQQATFLNTHTYSYQGQKGFAKNGRRNTDLACFQGQKGPTGDKLGSQASQIAFNYASISSTLTGKTILSATLTCTNLTTWYSTGGKMMLGYTKDTPGASTWNASDNNTTENVMHQSFTQAQGPLTFAIPISIVKAFVTGSAKALALGDGKTSDLNYYGSWTGGPSAFSLVVNYV